MHIAMHCIAQYKYFVNVLLISCFHTPRDIFEWYCLACYDQLFWKTSYARRQRYIDIIKKDIRNSRWDLQKHGADLFGLQCRQRIVWISILPKCQNIMSFYRTGISLYTRLSLSSLYVRELYTFWCSWKRIHWMCVDDRSNSISYTIEIEILS